MRSNKVVLGRTTGGGLEPTTVEENGRRDWTRKGDNNSVGLAM